jgi:hypothetical protein
MWNTVLLVFVLLAHRQRKIIMCENEILANRLITVRNTVGDWIEVRKDINTPWTLWDQGFAEGPILRYTKYWISSKSGDKSTQLTETNVAGMVISKWWYQIQYLIRCGNMINNSAWDCLPRDYWESFFSTKCWVLSNWPFRNYLIHRDMTFYGKNSLKFWPSIFNTFQLQPGTFR